MRKTVVGSAMVHGISSTAQPDWLAVSDLARAEVSSEDKDHPIESSFSDGAGWRAATPGRQTIRLIFDQPQCLKRIHLCFEETEIARTQEFSLRWCGKAVEGFHEIVRQQWNFDPRGSTIEFEDYRVDLRDVSILELNINPSLGADGPHASLACFRLA